MQIKLPPIQISTREALCGIFDEDAVALYITANVYLQMHRTIRQRLHDHRFSEWKVCRRGVIFVKTKGPHPYDPELHQLFLPLEGVE